MILREILGNYRYKLKNKKGKRFKIYKNCEKRLKHIYNALVNNYHSCKIADTIKEHHKYRDELSILNLEINELNNDIVKYLQYKADNICLEKVSRKTSITIVNKVIKINTNYGLMYRPLYRVENGKTLIKTLPDNPLFQTEKEYCRCKSKFHNNIYCHCLKNLHKTSIDKEFNAFTLNTHKYREDCMCIKECRCKALLYDDFCNPEQYITMKLLKKYGVIEYVTVEEQEYAKLAIDPINVKIGDEFSEIHGSLLFSLPASSVVFPEYNQSGRNNKQANMARQAIGIPSLDYWLRYDTDINILSYIEEPICRSDIMKILIPRELSAGQTKMCSLAVDDGTNQEDSFGQSKNSIDFGLMQTTSYKCYKESSDNRNKLNFAALKDTECIDEDGMPIIGSKVGKIVLNNQYTTVNNKGVAEISNIKIKSKFNLETRIDNVSIYTGIEDDTTIKIKERLFRDKSYAGNKFSQRNSQKMTVGEVSNSIDLPFVTNGEIPDAKPSPHNLPSRMTMSEMLEMLFGIYYLEHCDNTFRDSTAFNNSRLNFIKQVVKYYSKVKYTEDDDINDVFNNILKHRNCKSEFRDGRTGKENGGRCFYGPIYYQQLKHFAIAKLHVRKEGSIDTSTRQPTTGKLVGGGIRLGTMENRGLVASGVSKFIFERSSTAADARNLYACGGCGRIINKEADKYDATRIKCLVCGKKGSSEIINDKIICTNKDCYLYTCMHCNKSMCNRCRYSNKNKDDIDYGKLCKRCSHCDKNESSDYHQYKKTRVETKLSHNFNIPFCNLCKSTDNIRFIKGFKHCKLLFAQLLKTILINPQYHLEGIECDLSGKIKERVEEEEEDDILI